MTYIKKMVMHGFKSFARKTELPFDNSMNVIVGPNGSGKSNITDALCFVLGRLSIKSIRAAKAANLLFSGNKLYKGAQEASVELVLDNSDKTFSIDSQEVSIQRIVRKNGQSIYKINRQTKTRQDMIELMAQGGIDPNGFNIVLQGEIQSLVNATPEERRKIIEEVAGISIYETRKYKSQKELEKTDEKLKEVSSVLRERTSYLKNIDKERQDAISYQKLETLIKRCKATLINKTKNQKERGVLEIDKIIDNNNSKIEKLRKQISEKDFEIEKLRDKILTVNKQIKSSTSDEQEVLHREISDLKAELAGLEVRRENFNNRIVQGREKVLNLIEKIKGLKSEIAKIQIASPKIKEQQGQQQILQDKLDILEKERRKFYVLKSDLSTVENEKIQKEKSLIEASKEIQIIEHTIASLFDEIKYSKSISENEEMKSKTSLNINEITDNIFNLEKKILEREKLNAVLEMDVKREEKLKSDILQLQSCPICKQDVGEGHKCKISEEANSKIQSAKLRIEENSKSKEKDSETVQQLREKLASMRTKLNEINIDKIKLDNAMEKKGQVARITENQKELQKNIASINENIHLIRRDYEKLKNVEEDYDEIRLRLQEISFADVDVDTEIMIKKRESNRLIVEQKSIERDVEDSEIELKKIELKITEADKKVVVKDTEEQELYERAQKFFDQRNELQDSQKVLETDVIGMQHTVREIEDKINQNKIQNAQLRAQIDSLKSEMDEFGEIKLMAIPTEQIKEKLQKSQFAISRLGNVNMRALEVFDKIDEQVKLIQEKVEIIIKEKAEINNIIAEIDKKKKKSFLTTLAAINEYFTRNFSQLSKKGNVFLELENKKNPFDGGLNILVRVSRGRYFDVTSLSGGEKTVVALSLIFAIQEYKPYCFYVFDEIDAALDKRNSELLAALIRKYMTTGQYIVITHNDTLMSGAKNLYGVSMHENISKIVSLKI